MLVRIFVPGVITVILVYAIWLQPSYAGLLIAIGIIIAYIAYIISPRESN